VTGTVGVNLDEDTFTSSDGNAALHRRRDRGGNETRLISAGKRLSKFDKAAGCSP
jgi:hypothetical protein